MGFIAYVKTTGKRYAAMYIGPVAFVLLMLLVIMWPRMPQLARLGWGVATGALFAVTAWLLLTPSKSVVFFDANPPPFRKPLHPVQAPEGTPWITPDGYYPGRVRTIVNKADEVTSRDIRVLPGGGTYIGAGAPGAGMKTPFRVHRLPEHIVFELDLDGVDPAVIGIRVDTHQLTLTYPQGAPMPPGLPGEAGPDGTVAATFGPYPILIPARSWADVWTDVLRVHMVDGRRMPFSGASERTIDPTERAGRAPRLAPGVGERAEPEPLAGLEVRDLADAYEVVARVTPGVEAKLEYEAVGKLVTVTCVQAFETSTLETATRTRVVDRFLLHMPGPVTAEGSAHGVEGGAWVARVPKDAEAPLGPPQI